MLQQFFSDEQLEELSRKSTGALHRTQPASAAQKGERFPIDDPELEPVLEPRPVVIRSMCRLCWKGSAALSTRAGNAWRAGGSQVQRVLSVGGGANNLMARPAPKLFNKPVLNRSKASPAAANAAGEQTVTLGRSSG